MSEEIAVQKLEEAKQRFWKKVDIRGEGDCWNWKAGLTHNGYGDFRYRYKHWRAHRFAWTVTNSPIPNGLWVLHRCDNRACCNPAHCFLGTNADNMADKCAKGRQSKGESNSHMRGEKHHGAKLTEMDVREIRNRRQAGESQKSIASGYGIKPRSISSIFHRRSWRHVQ